MGRYGTSGGATFRVEGIEPLDLALHPEPVRRQYWRWVCELVLTAKDRELAAGLDKYGLAMVPISPRTRRYRKSVKGPADPNAPPLTPAYEASRTRSLFDGRAFPDRAEFFWRFDEFTGASWGRVLKFHARGLGHLPIRDVIGLSPQSMAWVRQQALARWMTWLRAPTPPPERKPRPLVPTPEPTGHMDLESYTFGIGATKEEVQRMIDAGRFSGFRQLHTFKPGEGPSAQQPRPMPPQGPPLPPTPKPAPRPKPYEIEYHGNLTDAEKAEHETWVKEIPEHLLKDLHAAGYKFVYADRLITYDPLLAQKQPRGWGPGMTWENAEGFHNPSRKVIFVSKEKKSQYSGQYVMSKRQKGALFHETSHAIDAVGPIGYHSTKADFLAAHATDAAALTPTQKKDEEYLLQPGIAGPSETFAEVSAILLGRGSGGEPSDKNFPTCAKIIAAILKIASIFVP